MNAISKNPKKGRVNAFYRKMKCLNNRYIAKSRMFKVSFKDKNINEVNFKGAIITKSTFKSATLTSCEFLGTNLSGCSFKYAVFKDCIFLNAKLDCVNFSNAKFDNVYFITQKISNCKNLMIDNSNIKIIKKIDKLQLSQKLLSVIDEYHIKSLDKITHILKMRGGKYHYLHIYILLENFTDEQLVDGLSKVMINKYYDFSTIFSMIKYLKKMVGCDKI